ncbi:pyruvate formate-lyase-activating protein [Anaerovorax odorimutans]|uniref:Pyruvate formate-lyase-activating enzyme n=1 Tax=Anaerovorax odorimutans TaxID=109327 RepID=A0ABT1RTH4_9FIRM|nr:pyruvate formate-lyase-activating protein [Anaerovorax odorimutans]MCQ4638509.1 pyruvate formate-lyase-activating protein [Anaerovorax odorimutans]
MITGKLHSIETFGAVDGPGIRTVFFLQGCPARCVYCHNPDSWTTTAETENITIERVVHIAKRGRPYYGKDGGVTFSGGEPLMQGEFLIEAMDALAEEGISTVIDTSGTYVDGFTQKVIEESQMLLLDVKHSDPVKFEEITGVNQDNLLRVIDMANEADKPLWIRQVIVPGLNDTEENVAELKEFARQRVKNLHKIELLGYHNMAIEKWDKLGIPYKLKDVKPMDRGQLARLSQLL